jgi:hypothetical protein
MNGDKVDPRAVLRGWLTHELASKEEERARLADAMADDERELHEIEWLQAAKAALDKALNWPADEPIKPGHKLVGSARKYARRPAEWKGRHGYEFVLAILTIRAREKCSVAAAIRQLQKDDPKKWAGNPRNLARRFDEIKDYWSPWVHLMIEVEAREAALLAEKKL